ncbi:UNVERIFIED_CONTAM: hypothetical protein HDU68_004373, partial [Siphonaria sp. JEL0065]
MLALNQASTNGGETIQMQSKGSSGLLGYLTLGWVSAQSSSLETIEDCMAAIISALAGLESLCIK